MPSPIVDAHPLAPSEIAEAFDYYESQRTGLGEELDGKINALAARIARLPSAAPMWRNQPNHRIAALDRFLYRLPYLIKRDMIRILALAHTSRRPGYWLDRLDPS